MGIGWGNLPPQILSLTDTGPIQSGMSLARLMMTKLYQTISDSGTGNSGDIYRLATIRVNNRPAENREKSPIQNMV
jgi:hypothetical protein